MSFSKVMIKLLTRRGFDRVLAFGHLARRKSAFAPRFLQDSAGPAPFGPVVRSGVEGKAYALNSAVMAAVEERRLKGLLKTAVAEVLEERQDLLRDALRESLEDIAILRAIQIGEKSPLCSRKKIFRWRECARWQSNTPHFVQSWSGFPDDLAGESGSVSGLHLKFVTMTKAAKRIPNPNAVRLM